MDGSLYALAGGISTSVSIRLPPEVATTLLSSSKNEARWVSKLMAVRMTKFSKGSLEAGFTDEIERGLPIEWGGVYQWSGVGFTD